MKNASSILALFCSMIILGQMSSCLWGAAVVHQHLSDKFYLIAPDMLKQLGIGYHYEDQIYIGVVDQTVYAVGYNDDFIIAKQHPSSWEEPVNKERTLYYVIDIRKIRMEREKLITEKHHFQEVYSDKSGKDSLDSKISQSTKYSPDRAEPLTYMEFQDLRKELLIPDNLDFTIVYEDFE